MVTDGGQGEAAEKMGLPEKAQGDDSEVTADRPVSDAPTSKGLPVFSSNANTSVLT